ncbi:MAG: hypothetical protein AAGE01_05075 [Pseudomonadota bacterium]
MSSSVDPTDSNAPSNLRSRLTLLAIVALFLAPVLAAVFLQSRMSDYAPEASRAYGELVSPVVALPDPARAALPDAQAWTLVVPPAACAEACTELLDLLGRLDRALGRHADEVAELVFFDGTPPAGEGAAVASPVPPAWQALLVEQGWADAGAILVDPLGNVMMRYPVDFDPSRMKRDLERLLKYSKFNES